MDMNTLMKQAEEMQKKVTEAQETLAKLSIKGIAGGGLAIFDLDGKYNLRKLSLSKDILKESLEDIIAIISAAYTDAKTKVDANIDEIMGAATSGMKLPE